jgi:type IV pilus assembly protein PilV
MKNPHSQSGVMLLEVLIGMLLFLVGIVGIVSLQAASAKHTIDAKYRTEAAYLANAIIGRMWADTPNLASYETPAATACPDPAATERDKWICEVGTILPNATGANAPTIAINGATVTITVQWQKDLTDPVHNHVVTTDISFL